MSSSDSRLHALAWRAAYVLLAVALVGGLARVLLHAGQDVYYIPLYGVGIAVAAFLVAAVGAALGWRSGWFGSVVLTMLGVVVAVAAVISFGILLLFVVLAIGVLVTRARWGTLDASAIAAGGLLGLGVFVLALLALSPPLVDCAEGSAGEERVLGTRIELVGEKRLGECERARQPWQCSGGDIRVLLRVPRRRVGQLRAPAPMTLAVTLFTDTWIRFVSWMALGPVVYVVYARGPAAGVGAGAKEKSS